MEGLKESIFIIFLQATKEGYELFRDRIKVPDSSTLSEGSMFESLLEYNITLQSIQNDKVGQVSDPGPSKLHEARPSTFKVLTLLNKTNHEKTRIFKDQTDLDGSTETTAQPKAEEEGVNKTETSDACRTAQNFLLISLTVSGFINCLNFGVLRV